MEELVLFCYLFQLLAFANGKVVMALEGGYNLKSTASSVLACVKVLLECKSIAGSLEGFPFQSTWHVIEAASCFPNTFPFSALAPYFNQLNLL